MIFKNYKYIKINQKKMMNNMNNFGFNPTGTNQMFFNNIGMNNNQLNLIHHKLNMQKN